MTSGKVGSCGTLLSVSAPGASMLQCKSPSFLWRTCHLCGQPSNNAACRALPHRLSTLALPAWLCHLCWVPHLDSFWEASPLSNEIAFTCSCPPAGAESREDPQAAAAQTAGEALGSSGGRAPSGHQQAHRALCAVATCCSSLGAMLHIRPQLLAARPLVAVKLGTASCMVVSVSDST